MFSRIVKLVECRAHKMLASDGVSCLGYSANWVDDAEQCKNCKKFIRYDGSKKKKINFSKGAKL